MNGNSKFFFDATTIKLSFETEVLPEETISVMLYNAGENFETTMVAETGAPVDGPVVKGYKFVGWALSEGGEVKFEAGAPISLYDLVDYVDATGVAHLYAVLEERIPNEGLIVAVWNYYVNGEKAGYEGASDTLYAEYAAYMSANGLSYNVEFRIYSETSVADFCAAVNKDGDIDVIIGAGNTVNANNGIDYLLRTDMVAEGLTSRKVVLLTDTDRATDTQLGSLNLIIFALFVGACLAGFATVYHRRTIGALVRYLLEQEAFSPESAKTLRDAEQDLNVFVRMNITRNVAFQRIVCMVDVPKTDEKGKKITLSDIPLYINPNERMRAEEMYSAKTSEDANMWMVLLSIFVFAVVAYISSFIVPDLIAMASGLFSKFS